MVFSTVQCQYYAVDSFFHQSTQFPEVPTVQAGNGTNIVLFESRRKGRGFQRRFIQGNRILISNGVFHGDNVEASR